MHKGDTIPGLLSIIFGMIFVIATYVNPKLTAVAQTSDSVPGAGFFPYVLGGVIIFLGILLLIRGLKQKGTVQFVILSEEGKKNLKIFGLMLIGVIAFFLFWKFTSLFIIGVPLLCLYLNFIFGRTWKFNILYSGIFTTFIYVVFTIFFSIQFTV